MARQKTHHGWFGATVGLWQTEALENGSDSDTATSHDADRENFQRFIVDPLCAVSKDDRKSHGYTLLASAKTRATDAN